MIAPPERYVPETEVQVVVVVRQSWPQFDPLAHALDAFKKSVGICSALENGGFSSIVLDSHTQELNDCYRPGNFALARANDLIGDEISTFPANSYLHV